jgi:hypothetical protein
MLVDSDGGSFANPEDTTGDGIDTTVPSDTSININDGADNTTSTSVTLSISAEDNVGVTGYFVSESSETPSLNDSDWQSVTSTTAYSDSNVTFTLAAAESAGTETRTVYVWFRDAAGNLSSSSDSIILTYYLPDTGQTESYTDTFGEDSDYLIHPPAYQDNGDGAVTDLNTGLMWQQATSSSQMDWDSAGSYCSGLSLAGHSDWRLPAADELQSIVDYGESGPSIDTTVFQGTLSSEYWSSTTYMSDTSRAWDVSFDVGGVFTRSKDISSYVRCVRGNSSATSFTDNSDGTVTDQKTGLMWQQATSSSSMNWEAALTYCEGLTLASQSDWRLPNIKELSSIVDRSQDNPWIDTTAFQVASSPFYWSSTARVVDTSRAWDVDFSLGYVHTNVKSDSYYVRCVRGGQ